MKGKYWGLIGIVIAVAITGLFVIGLFSSFSGHIEEQPKSIFHITLADPNLYEDGIFSDFFEIQKGEYFFRFVPNGDSPRTLSISLNGESFQFSEQFELEGTAQGTESATYYTWDYLGKKTFQILEFQELQIRIDPNGNVMGPVSVDIIIN